MRFCVCFDYPLSLRHKSAVSHLIVAFAPRVFSLFPALFAVLGVLPRKLNGEAGNGRLWRHWVFGAAIALPPAWFCNG
jgi:hypothetical protein